MHIRSMFMYYLPTCNTMYDVGIYSKKYVLTCFFCHSFYILIVQSFTIIIIPNHEFTQKVELKLRIEAYFCTLFRVQHTRYGRYIHICRCFFNKQHRQRAKPIYPIVVVVVASNLIWNQFLQLHFSLYSLPEPVMPSSRSSNLINPSQQLIKKPSKLINRPPWRNMSGGHSKS